MIDTLFGSKTVTLVLLFLERHGEVYATQIARNLKIPLNMVQKQLDRLALGKVLVAKTVGRRKIYTWNPRHPLLGPLQRLLARGNVVYKEDPADGSHLSIAERLVESEALTRQAIRLNPPRFKPFTRTFESDAKTPGSSDSRLLDVCRSLNQHHAQYVIVGGTACNLHGLIRATKDIDLLIPKDVGNAEAVLAALEESQTFGMAAELDAERVAKGPITVIGDIPRVNLLTVAWKVKFEEAIETAEHVKIDGVKIVYANLDTLLKSKATDRLQDMADVEKLKQIAGKK